jgi:hypothetical protein
MLLQVHEDIDYSMYDTSAVEDGCASNIVSFLEAPTEPKI